MLDSVSVEFHPCRWDKTPQLRQLKEKVSVWVPGPGSVHFWKGSHRMLNLQQLITSSQEKRAHIAASLLLYEPTEPYCPLSGCGFHDSPFRIHPQVNLSRTALTAILFPGDSPSCRGRQWHHNEYDITMRKAYHFNSFSKCYWDPIRVQNILGYTNHNLDKHCTSIKLSC